MRGVVTGLDLCDRDDMSLGEVENRLQRRPLIVVGATMTEIDQDAAVRREGALMIGVGDRGADRSVTEKPVADPRIGVGAANMMAREILFGDLFRYEFGVDRRTRDAEAQAENGPHTAD